MIEEGKGKYVHFIDFNVFMYNQILHHDRKHFCRYCLGSFNNVHVSEKYVNDCSKLNSKQIIKIAKNSLNLKSI